MKEPIFIIGNPRSGTTLLRLMLTSHKNICIPPECGFAIWWFAKYKSWDGRHAENDSMIIQFIDDLISSRKFENWNISRDELIDCLMLSRPQNYSALVEEVYLTHSRKLGKETARWGDKNNNYLNYIENIVEIFPNAYFIHIVRDCRDVVCSYLELSKKVIDSKYAPKLPQTLEKATEEWGRNMNKIRISFNNINWRNVVEIKYEDLVSDPEKILESVCTVLGENYDKHMLNYQSNNIANELEPKEFLQWKEKAVMAVNTQSVGRYKKELLQNDISLIETCAGPILNVYGYME